MSMQQNEKVVILAGGRGSRLKEITEVIPKPMVPIGEHPILWHIMKTYSHYGFNDFVLCLGYKGEKIKEYFLNYEAMNNDFTVKLGKHNDVKFHGTHLETEWNITLSYTGQTTQTGARAKRIQKYIDGEVFMLTYGDGIGNINIAEVLAFHKSHGKIGTITGVRPSSRFGEMVLKDRRVEKFSEKPQVMEGWVNGGFFVFNREFFDYLKDDDDCYLEREPLENLAHDKEMMVYLHEGFWQCVDTYRELQLLDSLWNSGNPPWKVWK